MKTQSISRAAFTQKYTQLVTEEPIRGVIRHLGAGMSWRQKARQLQREVHVFYFVFRHPRVPWYARLVAACAAGYPFSPIQMIPSYIPVLGFLDDLAVFFLGAKILQKLIPPAVFVECRELADANQIRGNGRMKSTPTVVAFVLTATVWLLGAVGTGVLMAKYISLTNHGTKPRVLTVARTMASETMQEINARSKLDPVVSARRHFQK
jgi:uncharacterized membrane protein YkvA (DUF1232 family)